MLGCVFTADDTCGYALQLAVHYAQGVLLRTGVDDSILHGVSGFARAECGIEHGRVAEHTIPGLCGLDAVLPDMELGHQEAGSGSGHELRVFQPRGNGIVCVAHPVGAHHGLLPDGYGAHPDGIVFL